MTIRKMILPSLASLAVILPAIGVGAIGVNTWLKIPSTTPYFILQIMILSMAFAILILATISALCIFWTDEEGKQ